jgi:hypothetical protein
MSELSCDTLFIGRNETHDLSRNLVNRVAVTDLRPLLPGPRALQQRFARLLEQIAFRGLLCPGKVDHLDRLIVISTSVPSLAHVDHLPRRGGLCSRRQRRGAIPR